MSAFIENSFGWCEYYTVVQPEPHYPHGRGAFGLAGPFADEAEARQARDILATKLDCSIGVMRCSFDTDNSPELFADLDALQESARAAIQEVFSHE
jgi:hypothetical protein